MNPHSRETAQQCLALIGFLVVMFAIALLPMSCGTTAPPGKTALPSPIISVAAHHSAATTAADSATGHAEAVKVTLGEIEAVPLLPAPTVKLPARYTPPNWLA